MDMTNGLVLLMADLYNKINVCIPLYYASCCIIGFSYRYDERTRIAGDGRDK